MSEDISGYICATEKDKKWETDPLKNCPESFLPFGTACMKLASEKVNFQAAQKSCENFNSEGRFKYAGLATVLDRYENLHLKSLGFSRADLTDAVWMRVINNL